MSRPYGHFIIVVCGRRLASCGRPRTRRKGVPGSFNRANERGQQWELERRFQGVPKRPISKGTAFSFPRLSIRDVPLH